jgi:5-methylcytosine-specific restriction endonuclease McrA
MVGYERGLIADKLEFLTMSNCYLHSHTGALDPKSAHPLMYLWPKWQIIHRTSTMAQTLDLWWASFLIEQVESEQAGPFNEAPDFWEGVAELMDNLACASCGEDVERESPYCSDFCRDLSKTVRASRKAYSVSRVDSDEFRLNIGTKLISIFKGGYPAHERALTKQEREAIFQRDKRICLRCGAEADQIDHIRGDSREPANLRAVCGPCNRALAMEVTRYQSLEEIEESFDFALKVCRQMAIRIAAPNALRVCDNHQLWESVEPKIRGRRRSHFSRHPITVNNGNYEYIDDNFEYVDNYLQNSMQKDN